MHSSLINLELELGHGSLHSVVRLRGLKARARIVMMGLVAT